jgi:hypothetical protein
MQEFLERCDQQRGLNWKDVFPEMENIFEMETA